MISRFHVRVKILLYVRSRWVGKQIHHVYREDVVFRLMAEGERVLPRNVKRVISNPYRGLAVFEDVERWSGENERRKEKREQGGCAHDDDGYEYRCLLSWTTPNRCHTRF